MKRNSIFVKISSVVLAAFMLTFSSCVPAVDDPLPAGNYDVAEAKKVLPLTNSFRTGSEANYVSEDNKTTITVPGLGNLVWDEGLENIAKVRAQEIAKSFSHTRPNGSSCFTAFDESGFSYSAMGENIAAGYSSANDVFIGWKEDGKPYSGQGHRRNMLGQKFTKIGIACFVPSEDVDPMNGTWPSSGKVTGVKYWVMELGR